MKHISELALILNKYFNWNKARITCLAQIIRGIIAVKTVNLAQIATIFFSNVQTASSYRRIQRFFKEFDFDPSIIIHFIFAIVPLPRKFMVIMDRTNWKLGSCHFNLLVLSIVYYGISIPIFWLNIARAGNSKTEHRMFSIFKIIHKIGKKRIQCLLADREFVGNEWFQWLINNEINFTIRIKSDTLVKRTFQDLPTNVSSLFRRLKKNRQKILKQSFGINGYPIYLAASRASDNELLVVASPKFNRKALKIYKMRWEIETLFGCLKTIGFNLEETHLTDQKKIEKLFFIIVIAFCWSYLIGIEKNKKKKIPVKSHQRKSQSLFRYGYEVLRKALFRGVSVFRNLYRFLVPKISQETWRVDHV